MRPRNWPIDLSDFTEHAFLEDILDAADNTAYEETESRASAAAEEKSWNKANPSRYQSSDQGSADRANNRSVEHAVIGGGHGLC
jgi:hypothetical protein